MFSANDNSDDIVLSNGQKMSPLCVKAFMAIVEPGFFPKPSADRIQKVEAYLAFANQEFDKQKESKTSRTADINRTAAEDIQKFLNHLKTTPVDQNTPATLNNLRSGSSERMTIKEYLLYMLSYTDMAIFDLSYVKKESKDAVKELNGGKSYPQFQPIYDKIASAFKPKVFKAFKFDVIRQVSLGTLDYVSLPFTDPKEAKKYLKLLKTQFSSAYLEKTKIVETGKKTVRLNVPDLEKRLQELALSSALTSSAASSSTLTSSASIAQQLTSVSGQQPAPDRTTATQTTSASASRLATSSLSNMVPTEASVRYAEIRQEEQLQSAAATQTQTRKDSPTRRSNN